jgi:hypothetical protein
MEPQQPPMPTQAAPAPAPHHASASHVPYESNPFRVSITGLVTILKTNPMAAILLMLVLALLIIGGYLIVLLMAVIAPILGILLGIAMVVCLMPVLLGSFAALGVSSMKGQTEKTMTFIKQATSKILPLLGAGILTYLIIVLGLLLFVVPGLIFMSWFSLTFFVMFDEGLGAIASMKRSKELAKGHTFEILGALFAGSLLSGGSSSGGGGLLSQAISMGPLIGRYEQLKALKASGAPKPKVHWLNYFLVLAVPVLVAVLFVLIMVSALQSSDSKKSTNDFNSTFDSSYTSPSYDSDSLYSN